MVGSKSPNHPPTKELICMHAIAASCRHQQNRIDRHRQQSDGYRFFNVLTSNALLAKVGEQLPEHRARLPETMVADLARHLGDLIDQQSHAWR